MLLLIFATGHYNAALPALQHVQAQEGKKQPWLCCSI